MVSPDALSEGFEMFFFLMCKYNVCTVPAGWKTKILKQTCALMFMPLFLSGRAKLGHGLLSGQYSKPPMKSELIEQVMKEEYKVLNWVCPAPKTGIHNRQTHVNTEW